MQSTTIGNKYPSVSFNSKLFESLFFFNWTSGWPQYSPNTIMDVGKMEALFALAYQNNFTGIQNLFGLPSENHARVLWDYINSVVDNTALEMYSKIKAPKAADRRYACLHDIGKELFFVAVENEHYYQKVVMGLIQLYNNLYFDRTDYSMVIIVLK